MVSLLQTTDDVPVLHNRNWVIAAVILTLFWFGSRLLDFSSGFVEYSTLQLVKSITIYVVGATIYFVIVNPSLAPIRDKAQNFFESLPWSPKSLLLLTLLLAGLGMVIYVSRDLRSANMGDTALFKETIFSTAKFEGFLLQPGGRSQMRDHNSVFLITFVPIVWLFGTQVGWYIIQYLHSLILTSIATVAGINANLQMRNRMIAVAVILAFFGATYTKNMSFTDVPFAASALGILIYGILSEKRRLLLLGFFLTLVTRETTVLTALVMLIFSSRRVVPTRTKFVLVTIGLIWIISSFAIMVSLDGPGSAGRYNECLTQPAISSEYAMCVYESVVEDLSLKLAFSVRIISFAPLVITSWFGLSGLLVELSYAWFANAAVFSLTFHFYIVGVTISILVGTAQIKRAIRSQKIAVMLVIFSVSTCAWQFLTLVRPNLF